MPPDNRAVSDLQIDPGTTCTRVFSRGALLHSLPSAVAVRVRSSGRREIVATGEIARALRGRTPPGIEVIRPFRAGRVADPELALHLIQTAVRAASGPRRWTRPRLLFIVAPDLSGGELAAWSNLGAAVDLGESGSVASPVVVARALEIAASQPALLVDIGASATRIAVVHEGAIYAATTVEVGGETMDGAVVRRLVIEASLAIGPGTAEAARLAACRAGSAGRGVHVAGRCLVRGTPKMVEISAASLLADRGLAATAIADAVRRTLESMPPALAPAVVATGALLHGGASVTPGILGPLRKATAIAWMEAEPEPAALAGALRTVSAADLLRPA